MKHSCRRCGDPADAHQHYAHHSGCARCPCPRYRRHWWSR